jgi:hypothetical protein
MSDRAVAAAWIGGAAAVAAAVVSGVFTLLHDDDNPGSQPNPTIPRPAITTSVPESTTEALPATAADVRLTVTRNGSHVSVEATTRGRPGDGHQWWFVLEVHNVNGHSEYYPRRQLSGEARQMFTLDVPSGVDLSRTRTGQVYDVTDPTTQKRLATGAADNDAISQADVVKVPCRDCTISNEVTLPFG